MHPFAIIVIVLAIAIAVQINTAVIKCVLQKSNLELVFLRKNLVAYHAYQQKELDAPGLLCVAVIYAA